MIKMEFMGKKTRRARYEIHQDEHRQRVAMLKLEKAPMSHRQAESIWREAIRNASNGECVTSWAGEMTR